MRIFLFLLLSLTLTIATQSVMATKTLTMPIFAAGFVSIIWGMFIKNRLKSSIFLTKIFITNIWFVLIFIFILIQYIIFNGNGVAKPWLYMFIPLAWFSGSWVALRNTRWLYIPHTIFVVLSALVIIPLLSIPISVNRVKIPVPLTIEFSRENGQLYRTPDVRNMRLVELTNTGCSACVLQHRKVQKTLEGTPELRQWLILNNGFDNNIPAVWEHFRRYSPGIVAEYVYDTESRFTDAIIGGKDKGVPHIAILGTDGNVYSIIRGYSNDMGDFWFGYMLRREMAYAATQSKH